MTAACGTRPIKRRSRSGMDAIKQAIHQVLAETHPATVRQTFYQLVSRGAIAKTETEYKSTVVRLLTAMRRSTKRSDTRSEGFDGDSVEVDSIPPATLRELVRNAITRHIDSRQMAASMAIEAEERETLGRIIGNLGRAA